MKGKSTTIVAVAALIGGAGLVILLSNAKTTIAKQGTQLTDLSSTITQNEKKIKGLESEKAILETAKSDLTQELSETKTELTAQFTKYDLKVAEYETFVRAFVESISSAHAAGHSVDDDLVDAARNMGIAALGRGAVDRGFNDDRTVVWHLPPDPKSRRAPRPAAAAG